MPVLKIIKHSSEAAAYENTDKNFGKVEGEQEETGKTVEDE